MDWPGESEVGTDTTMLDEKSDRRGEFEVSEAAKDHKSADELVVGDERRLLVASEASMLRIRSEKAKSESCCSRRLEIKECVGQWLGSTFQYAYDLTLYTHAVEFRSPELLQDGICNSVGEMVAHSGGYSHGFGGLVPIIIFSGPCLQPWTRCQTG